MRFNREVGSAREPAVFVDSAFARVQLKYALEYAAGRRARGSEKEDLIQSLLVDDRLDNAAREQGFDFGAENQSAVVFVVKQRLHADFVAAEKDRAVARVENRERENAVEPLGTAFAVLDKGFEHDLGVAVAAEMIAVSFQLLAQLVGVV